MGSREPTLVHGGPWALPGNGYGAITRVEKDIIYARTSCNVSIRKRKGWDARLLTISGTPNGIEIARVLAEAFILQSQHTPPDAAGATPKRPPPAPPTMPHAPPAAMPMYGPMQMGPMYGYPPQTGYYMQPAYVQPRLPTVQLDSSDTDSSSSMSSSSDHQPQRQRQRRVDCNAIAKAQAPFPQARVAAATAAAAPPQRAPTPEAVRAAPPPPPPLRLLERKMPRAAGRADDRTPAKNFKPEQVTIFIVGLSQFEIDARTKMGENLATRITDGMRNKFRMPEVDDIDVVFDCRMFNDMHCPNGHTGEHAQFLMYVAHSDLFVKWAQNAKREIQALIDQKQKRINFAVFCKAATHRSVGLSRVLKTVMDSLGINTTLRPMNRRHWQNLNLCDGSCSMCQIGERQHSMKTAALEHALHVWKATDTNWA